MPVALGRMRTSPIHTVRADSPSSAFLYSTLDVQFGALWSTNSRLSKCWPSPAKLTPSSSARPPGPANRTVGTMRTTEPPSAMFTCR